MMKNLKEKIDPLFMKVPGLYFIIGISIVNIILLFPLLISSIVEKKDKWIPFVLILSIVISLYAIIISFLRSINKNKGL